MHAGQKRIRRHLHSVSAGQRPDGKITGLNREPAEKIDLYQFQLKEILDINPHPRRILLWPMKKKFW
jgi:hypothetical protein